MKTIAKKVMALSATIAMASTTQVTANDDMYIGVQGSYPSFGLSVKKDIGKDYAVQGVLGALGDVTQFSVRGIYKFQKEKDYNLYGYGAVGFWSWGGTKAFKSESNVGFGLGAGLEYDLRKVLGNAVPLFWNIELGANIVSFDNYDFSTVGIGGGLHYKF